MNILTNAIDALLNQAIRQDIVTEFYGCQPHLQLSESAKPQITITTDLRSAPDDQARSSRWVVIRIADNGPGMSAAERQQLLESFSVEKRANKETSLALSYQIVTAKHGGKFYLRSQSASDLPSDLPSACEPASPNSAMSGTEFELWLPLI